MAPPFWRMAFVAVTAMLPATSRVVPFWMTPESVTVRVPAFTAMLPAGAMLNEAALPPLLIALPAPEIKAEPVAVTETSPPWPWNVVLLIVAPPVTLRSPTLIATFPPGAGPRAVVPILPRSPRVSDWAETVTAPPFAVGSLESPRVTIPLLSPVIVMGPVASMSMSPPAPAGGTNADAVLPIRAPPSSVSCPTSMEMSAPRPPPCVSLLMDANSRIFKLLAWTCTAPASPDVVAVDWSADPPSITTSPLASSRIATPGLLLPWLKLVTLVPPVRTSCPPRMTTVPDVVPKTLPRSSNVPAPLASMPTADRFTSPPRIRTEPPSTPTKLPRPSKPAVPVVKIDELESWIGPSAAKAPSSPFTVASPADAKLPIWTRPPGADRMAESICTPPPTTDSVARSGTCRVPGCRVPGSWSWIEIEPCDGPRKPNAAGAATERTLGCPFGHAPTQKTL